MGLPFFFTKKQCVGQGLICKYECCNASVPAFLITYLH